jgi:type I restriction enzyme R subunit
MPHTYTEDALIEQPAIALFAGLGWKPLNCFHEFEHVATAPSPEPSPRGRGTFLGRETPAEVVLVSRLRCRWC